MEILTSTGYKPLEEITSTDLLVSYDTDTGQLIYNNLLKKERWTHDMYPPQYNSEGGIIYTSEEYFDLQHGGWKFYIINDTWILFHLESVWINEIDVVHVNQLKVGDIIYDDQDQPLIISKIEETSTPIEWWKLSISGDHSYIADNLILHNASRYWVGGGSSSNWNATSNTNWSSSSGGANNATVPGSADDVFFDGAGANGNTNCTATGADCLTFTRSDGYTSTITIPLLTAWSIRGNMTISTGSGFSITTSVSPSGGLIYHFNSATLSMGGLEFDVRWSWYSGTKTLSGSDLILKRGFNNQLGCTINKTTSENILTAGFSIGGYTLLGNADIYVNNTILPVGAGTSGMQGSFGVANNVYISGGTINLDNLRKDGGTFKHITGTVNTLSNTFFRANTTTTTIDTGTNVNYNNFLVSNNVTVKLDSNMTITGATTLEGNATFTGSFGFTTPRLSATTVSSANVVLNTGTTYNVTQALFANTSRVGSILTFSSSSASDRAKLVLSQGATCNVLANFTRIDATGGRTINTFNGTVTDSINVRSFTDIPTYGSSYVM